MTEKGLMAMLVSFGILTLLLTGGCSYKHISYGSEITHYEVAKIVDGKTNKEEIFILFGNPSKTMDNEKVFFYNWTRGGKGHLFWIGGGSAQSHSLVIVFDDKGIVKNHRITRGATEGGTVVGD